MPTIEELKSALEFMNNVTLFHDVNGFYQPIPYPMDKAICAVLENAINTWRPAKDAPRDGTQILLKNAGVWYHVFWNKSHTGLEGWCKVEDEDLFINPHFDEAFINLPNPPEKEND